MEKDMLRINGFKNRVGDKGDFMIGMSSEEKSLAGSPEMVERFDSVRRRHLASRSTPLMLIHVEFSAYRFSHIW